MVNRKVILLFILTILSFEYIYSQQKLIDSLNSTLKNNTLNDFDRLQTMNLLTKYSIEEDKEESYKLADDALSLARTKPLSEQMLTAFMNKALILEKQDSIEASYYMMDTCLLLARQLGTVSASGEALMNIAAIKHRYKDETNILPLVLDALDIAKKLDNKELKVKICYFLTNSYYFPLRDLDNMVKYSNLSEQEAVDVKDVNLKMLSIISQGTVYRMKYLKDRSNDTYIDTSIVFLKKGLELYKTHEGYISSNKYFSTLGHLMSSYTYKTYSRNDSTFYIYPDSIYKYSKIMLDKAIEIKNPYFVAIAYDFLSGYESNNKNFVEAENILIKALDVLEDHSKSNYAQLKHSINLSLVYQLRINKKYEEALDYMEEAYTFQEQIFKNKYIREGQITEAKYRLKENHRQLQLSQERAIRQKKSLIGSIIIALLLITFVLLFYQLKLKTARQKALLLKKEKEEIRLQALLKEKELEQAETANKNLKLEKALEKERAERQALEINQLQKEIIVGSAQLEQKNETIEIIKQKINENKLSDYNDIKEILLSDKLANKSFDDFHDLFEKIHPHFYSKLQEKAKNKLTALDLKYCTYIFMNLSSKEIANIIHVNSNTVRTTKYRLKIKLNLGKDDDLSAYIKNLI